MHSHLRSWTLREDLGRARGRATAKLLYAISVAILALLVLLVGPGDSGPALALVVVAMGMVTAAALFPPARDGHDFGDLLFLCSLPFLLGFGLRTTMSLAGFVPTNSVGSIVADPFEFVFDDESLRALTLAVISWSVLYAGYGLRLGELISAKLPNPSIASVPLGSIRMATVALATIGWIARIASASQGLPVDASSGLESINALSTLLLWLSFLTTAASTLAVYSFFFRDAGRSSAFLAVVLVSAEVVSGLISGSRTLVFTPLVGTAAIAYLTGRFHLRVRHLVLIPLFLLIVGVTDTYRNPGIISTALVDVADTGARVQVAVEESVEQGPIDLTARGALNIAVRYHGLYSVAQILRVGPPTDLPYGTNYVAAIPAALIPRFLWADKPFPTYGVDFGREYFGVPDSVGVSIAPTWIGDLLLSVPLFLTPLAMGALGVLLRALRGYGDRGRDGASFAVLLYPALLPIIVQSDGWITSSIWEATQAIAVLSVALALMRSLGAPGVASPRALARSRQRHPARGG